MYSESWNPPRLLQCRRHAAQLHSRREVWWRPLSSQHISHKATSAYVNPFLRCRPADLEQLTAGTATARHWAWRTPSITEDLFVCLRPVYSDATQLNSTSSGVQLSSVELSCIGEVSIATPTQLNSTHLTYFALIGCTLQLGQLHCRSSATVELRRWGCL